MPTFSCRVLNKTFSDIKQNKFFLAIHAYENKIEYMLGKSSQTKTFTELVSHHLQVFAAPAIESYSIRALIIYVKIATLHLIVMLAFNC